VLVRTNADAVREVMDATSAGRSVRLVGGKSEIVAFAEAASQLKAGRRTSHHDLAVFPDWDAVQEYVTHPEGEELKMLVRLVDRFGPETIIAALNETIDNPRADLTVSTVHKAKGLEWPSVAVRGFDPPGVNRETGELLPIPRAQAMQLYVAVTRAQLVLDATGLEALYPHMAQREGVY
jgi:ATP-dependent exoDNAse (exonuclease V) beta subunit